MDRKEYLQKMQSYREELQAESKRNRETLDKLANEHMERARAEADFYKKLVNEVRDAHTEKQHEVERKMHELKVQWAIEHPVEEVIVVNNG